MNERILYKYRCWDNPNHIKTLTANEIYLASPQEFNDPFDCRILPNFKGLDTDEKINQYIDIVVASAKIAAKDLILDFEKQKEVFKVKFKTDFNGVISDFERLHFHMQNTRYGIFSLSWFWDSILMWSHYSDYHKGFCVGFDEEKLKEVKEFSVGKPVIYGDEFPDIDPLDQDIRRVAIKEIYSKASSWEYEGEFRLFSFIGPKNRIVKLPDNCFKEIIIGLKFPEEHVSSIKSMAREKGIKIFKTVLVDRQFKVNRVEIK